MTKKKGPMSSMKKIQRDTLVKKFGRLMEIYIHKDIGLCAKQAIINNEMRPLDTILKHGDTVTIISQSDVDNQKYSAEPGWMRFIKTQKAKEYIIRYLEIRFSELEG
jgi:(p)ppGpp synthase/HD superfamily hydrolase